MSEIMPDAMLAPPIVAKRQRSSQEVRAIQRAWNYRRFIREQREMIERGGRRIVKGERARERAIRCALAMRKSKRSAWFMTRLAQDTNRNNLATARHWIKKAEGIEAKRRRSTLLARQRGQQMGLMATLAHRQAAEIEAVKLAPTYFNAETGLEQADHTARAAHHARTAIDKAERVTGELGEARAAMARMQREIERLADAMVTENMRALRAEAALAAITARANGWPPAVQCVTVKFAA